MADAPEQTMKSRVLLVDDHSILRQGMAAMINDEPDMVVCGEADGVRRAIQVTEQTSPVSRWWTFRFMTETVWS